MLATFARAARARPSGDTFGPSRRTRGVRVSPVPPESADCPKWDWPATSGGLIRSTHDPSACDPSAVAIASARKAGIPSDARGRRSAVGRSPTRLPVATTRRRARPGKRGRKCARLGTGPCGEAPAMGVAKLGFPEREFDVRGTQRLGFAGSLRENEAEHGRAGYAE